MGPSTGVAAPSHMWAQCSSSPGAHRVHLALVTPPSSASGLVLPTLPSGPNSKFVSAHLCKWPHQDPHCWGRGGGTGWGWGSGPWLLQSRPGLGPPGNRAQPWGLEAEGEAEAAGAKEKAGAGPELWGPRALCLAPSSCLEYFPPGRGRVPQAPENQYPVEVTWPPPQSLLIQEPQISSGPRKGGSAGYWGGAGRLPHSFSFWLRDASCLPPACSPKASHLPPCKCAHIDRLAVFPGLLAQPPNLGPQPYPTCCCPHGPSVPHSQGMRLPLSSGAL